MFSINLLLNFYVLIIFMINYSTADVIKIKNDLTIHSRDQVCTSKSEACSINVDIPAIAGPPGQKGIKGNAYPGRIGPPGLPGLPGVCARRFETKGDDLLEEGNTEFASKTSPATEPCCSAPSDSTFESRSGYYMGPYSEDFEVYCNVTTKETCIPGNTTSSVNFYSHDKKKSFWISEKNLNLRTIYELTDTQIEWLQKKSKSAYQTLRYYCKNSTPKSTVDVKKLLSLLTWNERVIDLLNNELPIEFEVPPETDRCSKPSTLNNEVKSTDIIIKSKVTKRLPVRDVRIKNKVNGPEYFSVKPVQLCFSC